MKANKHSSDLHKGKDFIELQATNFVKLHKCDGLVKSESELRFVKPVQRPESSKQNYFFYG